MKHALALGLSSLIAVVPFLACEDSPGNGSTGTFDAPDGAFTAADGVAPGPDAATDGASTDAGVDAAPSDSATVVVTRAGVADPGVSVVFADATGAILETVATGASGTASGTIASGGQVTVALGAQGSRQLITYLGVKPGDTLNIVERTTRPLSITLASPSPGGGISIAAGNYNCSSFAASTANPVNIGLTPECLAGAAFPVLASVPFNETIYYSFKKNVTPAASGTTAVSGLSTWAIGTAFTLSIANAPDLPNPTAFLGLVAENESAGISPNTAIALAAGAATASFTIPGGYADAYQGELQYVSFLPSGFQQVVSLSTRVAAPATTQALDLTAGVLPTLLTVTASAATPAQPSLTWTASAALDKTDSGVASVSFAQPIVGGGSEDIEWTFIVPPGTMSVTAPLLPASLVAFAPTAASTLGQPSVAFFESDLISGYDVVRAQAGAFGLTKVPLGAFSGALIPALPANGTLRATALAPGG